MGAKYRPKLREKCAGCALSPRSWGAELWLRSDKAMRMHWTTTRVQRGLMKATLHLRGHTAEVWIRDSSDWFQVTYADSQNLGYSRSGSEERIHKNYNGWVSNLAADISDAVMLHSP
jgi:hypothetical protein